MATGNSTGLSMDSTALEEPDVCAVKVYFPQEQGIRVHQSQIKQASQLDFIGMAASISGPGILRNGPRIS